MNKIAETAKKYIADSNPEEALKLARKRHVKDDIDNYLMILDLLIEDNYLPAVEEKGAYFQYYDESHDAGDYGEKYFDQYLTQQPHSINVLCDKALSKSNKGNHDEALTCIDEALKNYDDYSKIEKPRITKKEVLMSKIKLLIRAKRHDDALRYLNQYESQYGPDNESDLYKGQMLQKTGKNTEALEYLNKSLQNENTLAGFNAKADALYELGNYHDALKNYLICIGNENKAEVDLELKTNFNYKAAFCCVNMGNDAEAVKFLNKTINMLNPYGRLPKDLEAIYQKCSFEKERILKKGEVKDEEFGKSRFLSLKTSAILLAVVLILYVILRYLGYH